MLLIQARRVRAIGRRKDVLLHGSGSAMARPCGVVTGLEVLRQKCSIRCGASSYLFASQIDVHP